MVLVVQNLHAVGTQVRFYPWVGEFLEVTTAQLQDSYAECRIQGWAEELWVVFHRIVKLDKTEVT